MNNITNKIHHSRSLLLVLTHVDKDTPEKPNLPREAPLLYECEQLPSAVDQVSMIYSLVEICSLP
ncbi:hypothetical protein I7I53_08208 [Histoplasma capsulatum var. duboisii H88]|uniref:Uncharacterized protein n=1 Tax=Ajellomyces capsulatus (strain H88) TaxID=544711 RepID=A0A8A1LF78_AJEC8|nr:hypothetical protein I7I53_08208 [Histoplasma capsulatum var. duboisii H88]